MTLAKIKKYGTFLMYCDERKGYLYMMNNRIYKINGQGVEEI